MKTIAFLLFLAWWAVLTTVGMVVLLVPLYTFAGPPASPAGPLGVFGCVWFGSLAIVFVMSVMGTLDEQAAFLCSWWERRKVQPKREV